MLGSVFQIALAVSCTRSMRQRAATAAAWSKRNFIPGETTVSQWAGSGHSQDDKKQTQRNSQSQTQGTSQSQTVEDVVKSKLSGKCKWTCVENCGSTGTRAVKITTSPRSPTLRASEDNPAKHHCLTFETADNNGKGYGFLRYSNAEADHANTSFTYAGDGIVKLLESASGVEIVSKSSGKFSVRSAPMRDSSGNNAKRYWLQYGLGKATGGSYKFEPAENDDGKFYFKNETQAIAAVFEADCSTNAKC